MNSPNPAPVPTADTLSWTHSLFDRLLDLSRCPDPRAEQKLFIRLLSEHHLTPLYLRSRHPSLEDVDEEDMSQMLAVSQWNSYRVLSMTSRFRRCTKLLRERGIRYAVYKGPTLSMRLFSDIAARQYSDIDLLIHPRDLFLAFEILTAEGFGSALRPNPFIRAYLEKSRRDLTLGDDCLRLDIHQQIARGPRFYSLPEEIWAALDQIEIYGDRYPVLPVEYELVVLAVHGARHGWDHYKLVLDFAGLLMRNPQMDWDRIDLLVQRFQARTMFDLAISLGRTVLGQLAPNYRIHSPSSRLKSALERHRAVLEEGKNYTDMSMLRQFFRLQNTMQNRIKLALFYLGYPRPEDPLLQKFSRPSALPLLPLIHPASLFLRSLRGSGKTPPSGNGES